MYKLGDYVCTLVQGCAMDGRIVGKHGTADYYAVKTLDGLDDYAAAADFTRDEIIGKMAELRAGCDEAETLTAAEYWPFPTYGDLLFGV